jgi:pimeloyl-ACP methyl ester carboxylesterase
MAVQSVFRLGLQEKQRAWDRWIAGRLGHRIQVEERRVARRELRRLFGQVVVQVGGTAGFPLIADSLAPVRFHVVFGGELPRVSHCPVIIAEDNLLPFPTDSVDILVLQHSLRRLDDGRLTQHYDPQILKQFGGVQNPTLAWAMFSSITCRMLLIRGMDSDILPASIADRMVNSALRVERLDIPNTGHAPFLNTPEQIAEIRSFLTD